MKKTRGSLKGVSPVIATVLLLAMVIVIALIIFLWVRELGGETITKFDGKNIETVCNDVEFSADYVNGKISIANTGIVPIFSFKVKLEQDGGYETKNIQELGNWPNSGLDQGGAYSSLASQNPISVATTRVVLIPVLLGESSKGERTYVCRESQYGYELIV